MEPETSQDSIDPAAVFPTTLVATACSTVVGICAAKLLSRFFISPDPDPDFTLSADKTDSSDTGAKSSEMSQAEGQQLQVEHSILELEEVGLHVEVSGLIEEHGALADEARERDLVAKASDHFTQEANSGMLLVAWGAREIGGLSRPRQHSSHNWEERLADERDDLRVRSF